MAALSMMNVRSCYLVSLIFDYFGVSQRKLAPELMDELADVIARMHIEHTEACSQINRTKGRRKEEEKKKK
jgi:hypothetical protein